MKYWKYILLLVLTLVFTTCKEEEPTMMIATLEMENVTFDISYREVSLQGRMVTNATVQEMVMEYSTDSAFREVKQAPMSKVNPKSDEPIYQVKLQELNENNLYYIRSRAVNKYSSVASASQTFKTLAFHLPEVQTDSIMDISVSSATLYATLLDRGTDQAPQVGFCFADHPEVTMENGVNLSYPQLENKDSVTFAIELTQLQDNVTYYVRAYAQNVKGVAYGQEISFTTTEIVPPTLGEVMIPSLSISYTTAMVSCEVLDEGGAPVIERGVCYSTMPNPTVESTKVSSGSGLGLFSCNLNDLIDGKTYYVRAYAINSKGTGYSQETTFTTVAYGMPMVMTGEVTDVTYTAAKVKGNVTSGGGLDITERGICYSTSHNPTEKDQKVVSGSGLGEYTCSLSDLTEATTYYARAYATNNKGTAYGEEVSFTTPDYTIPTVTTTAATNLSYETATCGGVVTSDGDLMITERGICYSTNPNPTIMSDKVTRSGSVGVFTCTLQGLSDGVSYYFRAYATNAKGTGYGELMTFTTPAYGQPVVTTSDVTSITYTTAKAGGVVTGDGGKEVTERGVCYAVDKTPTIADTKLTNGKGIGSYACSLTGLTAGTTYNVRAYATNSIGTTYGEMKTFTTPAYGAPVVSTSNVFGITAVSATAGGEVTADGGQEVTERGVCFGLTANPTLSDTKVASGKGLGSYTCNLTGLTEGTTYHVRAYATNDKGTSYGEDKTFVTTAYLPPTVTTGNVTDITYTTATAAGNVTADGGQSVTEKGVCLSTSSEPTIYNTKISYSEGGLGNYTCNITDLTPGTTYHLRAYATNSKGTSYGAERTFATISYNVPTVQTVGSSNVSYTTATCKGQITSDGGSKVTECGICYSTWQSLPDIYNPENMKMTATADSSGNFSCDLTELLVGFKYYYRAYAVNSEGVAYGTSKTFTTTSGSLPTVTVNSPTNISYTTVEISGNVTADGGLDITERGICYSTSYEPTINDSKVLSGSGTGEFTCYLTNLEAGTTYYYRAFATNMVGTSYGESYYKSYFTTKSYDVPTVTTTDYSNLSFTSVTVGGNVTANGGYEVTEYGICISRTNGYPTVEEDSVIVCGSGLGEFTRDLTDLADGTRYYYRAYAKTSYGVGYGSRYYFTTSSYYAPSVSTKSYSDLSYTSVTVGGNVTSGGDLDVTEYGICISRDTYYPTIENDSVVVCGSGLGEFTHQLTNLQDGTRYYYRAYAKNAKGVGYGDYYSFTTYKFEVPSVSTTYYSDVTYTTAMVGGKVTDEKGHEVTEYGICISRTHTYPTIEEDSVIAIGSGLGEFSHKLTDLTDGTEYWYRAYAKSSYGVGYGDYHYFVTNTYPRPSVSTYSVSEITYFTAKFYGYADNLSEHPTTEHGFCYATTSNPTVNDTKIVVSNTSNYFDIVVDGLEAGTTYYVRAYAINEYGVKYGGEQVFTTIAYSVPTLTTNDASYVSFETAVCGGKVTAYGGKAVTAYGVCYSTSPNPTIADNTASGEGDMTNFLSGLENLTNNTTYYYRAYATNEEGTGYGPEKSFTTVDYNAAVIYYTADSKLNEVTSGTGFHTNAFGVTMESHTFENGQGTIRFTDKITKIDGYAFENCSTMTSVTIPYSITEIGSSAFVGCTGLTTFDIPENVKSLDGTYVWYVFRECSNLTAVHVAAGNNYFCDVDGIVFTKDKKELLFCPESKPVDSYEIPSGVERIGYRAFQYCTNLTSVTFPEGLLNIDAYSFQYCSGLTTLTIPNSVTNINGEAFKNCENLETIDIGSGVTSMSDAFSYCKKLTSITCRALTPPYCGGSFSYVDKSIPLYVPKFSVNSYKNADYWKDFTNILPIP